MGNILMAWCCSLGHFVWSVFFTTNCSRRNDCVPKNYCVSAWHAYNTMWFTEDN